MIKVIGMMRIKDCEKWIKRSLKSCLAISEHVVILDDHSSDRTIDICKKFKNVTIIPSPFEGLNEVRDKNFLFKEVLKFKPDWIVPLDGDEEFSKKALRELPGLIEKYNSAEYQINVFIFKFIYLWNSIKYHRVDGVYANIIHPRLFSLKKQDVNKLSFISQHSCGYHCGNFPRLNFERHDFIPDLNVLHYGYVDPEERMKKYKMYTATDPNNEVEGGYVHIIEKKNRWCPDTVELKEWEDK